MKLLNRWINEQMPPQAWSLYRALEKSPFGRPIAGEESQMVRYEGLHSTDFAGLRPPDVDESAWFSIVAELLRGCGAGNTHPMECYLLCGLCTDGPRVYCPDPDAWDTLGRSECNFSFGSLRTPFPTLLVAVPESRSPDLSGAGRPAFVAVRQCHGMVVVSCYCVGGPARNLNVVLTWTDPDEVIESRMDFIESPDFVPDRSADGWTMPFEPDEGEFFGRAKRVVLNASMLLTSYGHTTPAPANAAYARRLRETLSKRTAPEGAKRQARSELDRMPLVVTLSQEVVLREHRLTTLPGEPTGRHVRPHWRRGHWANVRTGPGRLGTRRVFRAELFVNLHMLGGESPRPATVVYRADAAGGGNLPTRGQNAPADTTTPSQSGNSP